MSIHTDAQFRAVIKKAHKKFGSNLEAAIEWLCEESFRDPVLRNVLVRNGVIVALDLDTAETADDRGAA